MKLVIGGSKIQGGGLLVTVIDRAEKMTHKKLGLDESIEVCSQKTILLDPNETDPLKCLKDGYKERKNGKHHGA